MTKLEYTFKTDTLFKILFVQHPNLLKQLVSELLGIKSVLLTLNCSAVQSFTRNFKLSKFHVMNL
jgi:hypothetical protein